MDVGICRAIDAIDFRLVIRLAIVRTHFDRDFPRTAQGRNFLKGAPAVDLGSKGHGWKNLADLAAAVGGLQADGDVGPRDHVTSDLHDQRVVHVAEWEGLIRGHGDFHRGIEERAEQGECVHRPLKKGFVARSRPIVVAGPWPQ